MIVFVSFQSQNVSISGSDNSRLSGNRFRSGRIQGAPPDSFSSGDISRENVGRTSQNVPQESRDTFTTENNPADLENELTRRVARKSRGRSRGHNKVQENPDEYNEEVQSEEELENLQYADHHQLGRLVKKLHLQIKESKTSQVRTR